MTRNLNSFSSFEQYSFPTSFCEFHFLRVSTYCLVHHPSSSSDITNATYFSTSPTLAQGPPYPRWHTTNGLSPIIMNEVFHFQENDLRVGIHYLVETSILHISVLTLYLVMTKVWKLIPDKIKHASTLSAFKAKIHQPLPMSTTCNIYDQRHFWA